MIQEIVNHPDWEVYGDMALFITGQGLRQAVSFDGALSAGNPNIAPRLRIRVRGALGDGAQETVRTYLKQTVMNMFIREGAMTPIVDALYEGWLYFSGGDVLGGESRNNKFWHSISHPGSHNGDVLTPEGCTYADYWSEQCEGEKITTTPSAQYHSPISSNCQANHIVLLTDGETNINTTHGKITNRLGSCISNYQYFRSDKFNQDESCGVDLVQDMFQNDVRSSIPGSNVKTHTIGYAMGSSGGRAVSYLKELAKYGGGNYFSADTAEELLDAFRTIIAQAMTESTSFAAPALSVNSFTKLFHNDEVYFSLFKPEHQVSWHGNVKKFRLCDGEGCSPLGAILDQDGNSAIISAEEAAMSEQLKEDQIKDSAYGLWNTKTNLGADGNPIPDGGKVTEGGAGARIPLPVSRTLYTEIDGDGSPDRIYCDTNALDEVNDNNAYLTKAILGLSNDATDAERRELIAWICGYETYTDADNNTLREWLMRDPLHSPPGPVTYGGSDDNPETKIFIATNEGTIRMLDGATGVENWMFIPRDMLAIQKELKINASSTGEHLYGLDGVPSFLVVDNNRDSQIDGGSGDSVQMFIGMRRGGKNIYAFDLTPNTNGNVLPKLMWTIEGGGGDFAKLGQTWSTPKPTRVYMNGAKKIVLIFGGGYEPESQDQTRELIPVTNENYPEQGNAIYMVDPDTGERLWWASNSGSGADLNLPGMDYPIPSDIAFIDSDGDAATDRLYVGDTGGQVWRIDLRNDLSKSVGGRLAILADQSADAADADKRRFFYPPDVVFLKDLEYSLEGNYDLVLIPSGYRAHPLDDTIHDRFYALRDRAVNGLVDVDNDGDGLEDAGGTGDGLATQDAKLFLDEYDENNPDLYGFYTLTEDKLYNATANILQQGDDSGIITLDEAKEELQRSLGWYIELQEPDGTYLGEKGLASPIVLEGKVFLTTYVPQAVTIGDACSTAQEGRGKLYALDVLTGGATLNLDESNDVDEDGDGETDQEILEDSDRMEGLGEGIPPAAQGVYQKQGITLLVGRHRVDHIFELPRSRIYWVQE